MNVPGERETELLKIALQDKVARELGIRPGSVVRSRVFNLLADLARVEGRPADDVQVLSTQAEAAAQEGEVAAAELKRAEQSVNN